MTCAILIPSLNRPQRLADVVATIHRNTPEDHRILLCVSDLASRTVLDELGEWYLDDEGCDDRRYVTRMNKLIRHIGDADTIFFGSDDVIHQPGWLGAALKVMDKGPDCVVVNDLRNPHGTQALIRSGYLAKAVVDAPWLAFHEGYLHNFADTEQHFTAYMRNTYARAWDSHVEHLHPVFGAPNAMPWDSTYTDAVKGWDHDKALFTQRIRLIEEALQ